MNDNAIILTVYKFGPAWEYAYTVFGELGSGYASGRCGSATTKAEAIEKGKASIQRRFGDVAIEVCGKGW